MINNTDHEVLDRANNLLANIDVATGREKNDAE
jgi:hypothetical protein